VLRDGEGGGCYTDPNNISTQDQLKRVKKKKELWGEKPFSEEGRTHRWRAKDEEVKRGT